MRNAIFFTFMLLIGPQSFASNEICRAELDKSANGDQESQLVSAYVFSDGLTITTEGDESYMVVALSPMPGFSGHFDLLLVRLTNIEVDANGQLRNVWAQIRYS